MFQPSLVPSHLQHLVSAPVLTVRSVLKSVFQLAQLLRALASALLITAVFAIPCSQLEHTIICFPLCVLLILASIFLLKFRKNIVAILDDLLKLSEGDATAAANIAAQLAKRGASAAVAATQIATQYGAATLERGTDAMCNVSSSGELVAQHAASTVTQAKDVGANATASAVAETVEAGEGALEAAKEGLGDATSGATSAVNWGLGAARKIGGAALKGDIGGAVHAADEVVGDTGDVVVDVADGAVDAAEETVVDVAETGEDLVNDVVETAERVSELSADAAWDALNAAESGVHLSLHAIQGLMALNPMYAFLSGVQAVMAAVRRTTIAGCAFFGCMAVILFLLGARTAALVGCLAFLVTLSALRVVATVRNTALFGLGTAAIAVADFEKAV